MDKIFAKILETALLPIITLLTEIRDQHKAPAFPNTAPLPAGLVPAKPVEFVPAPPTAAPIADPTKERQELGEKLMAVAKVSPEKAMALLGGFTAKLESKHGNRLGQPCIYLAEVSTADYPALAAAIAAASVKPAAATDMFA